MDIEVEEIAKSRKGFYLRDDTIADIEEYRLKIGTKGITAARLVEILVERYVESQQKKGSKK
jgi:hypothetical protein